METTLTPRLPVAASLTFGELADAYMLAYHLNESFSTECPSLSKDARCDRADRGDEMFYRKNMGSKESWARVIGGALIVACSLTQIGLTLLGLVLAISGVLTALTGLIGFCPACAIAGRKSLEGPR